MKLPLTLERSWCVIAVADFMIDNCSPILATILMYMQVDDDDVQEVTLHLKRLRRQAASAAAFKDLSPALLAEYANDFTDTQSVMHQYLRHCRDSGITPEAFFIRKKVTGTLDLRHYSLGNKRAVALSLALASLPLLQHINLSDNRLNDEGLRVVVSALNNPKSSLYSLDVSSNEFGPKATSALCALLTASTTLSRLCLSHCKINTHACVQITNVLTDKCNSLTLLDLSHNAIQAAGGAAIGRMLQSRALEELDLSWNQIGDKGVEAIARTLTLSRTPLRWLSCAWNSITCVTCSLALALV